MRKLVVIIIVTFFIGNLMAQQIKSLSDQSKCGTMEYTEILKQNDPTYESKLVQMEKFVQNHIANHPNKDSNEVVTIPVVVHIIYNTSEQNISDTKVTEQIAILNTDYAGLNTHSMYSFSTTLKANTELQFCLANVDPEGNPTTGIERKETTVTQFSNGTQIKYTSQGGLDAWNTNQYMNIWVCNLGTSLYGFAEFPTNPITVTFGVVINYICFGLTNDLHHNLGGITTHEIGHCFNLRHIWGDESACAGTDYCDDTPNQAGPNYGHTYGLLLDACTYKSPGIMYMNFMDYSDDQDFANFTPNQKTRIHACFATGGPLEQLGKSVKCSPTLVADFEVTPIINLFPNPATGSAYVDIAGISSKDIQIELYNMFGILQHDIVRDESTNLMKIDLNGLAKGVYIVKINTPQGGKIEKLLVY